MVTRQSYIYVEGPMNDFTAGGLHYVEKPRIVSMKK